MSRPIEFTANYQIPAEAVHRTLTDERFWNHRIEGAADVTVERLVTGEGTIDVCIAQKLDPSSLPSLVSKFIKGDFGLVRSEIWGPFDGTRAEGTFVAETMGLPIKATGSAVLTVAADGGATMSITGEVVVSVKLVGGTIEGLAGDQIVNILGNDQGAIEEWATANA
ncbi:DUF2505 domain-containing protein [Rhodococcus sp. NPDC058514]|uniref:DUF2505 domain-containing protein n=1 Tax=unclassified Rhodococcus (in: high G+C Gram-positive bacteria) TaxID=192944 RepID=UPI00364730E1